MENKSKVGTYTINMQLATLQPKLLDFIRQALWTIDIEYNKRLDRQRLCLEDDFNGGSNNIVQSNKSV